MLRVLQGTRIGILVGGAILSVGTLVHEYPKCRDWGTHQWDFVLYNPQLNVFQAKVAHGILTSHVQDVFTTLKKFLSLLKICRGGGHG